MVKITELPNFPILWDTCAIISNTYVPLHPESLEGKTQKEILNQTSINYFTDQLKAGKLFYTLQEVIEEIIGRNRLTFKQKLKRKQRKSHTARLVYEDKENNYALLILGREIDKSQKSINRAILELESRGRVLKFDGAKREDIERIFQKHKHFTKDYQLSETDMRVLATGAHMLSSNRRVGIVSNDRGIYLAHQDLIRVEGIDYFKFPLFLRVGTNEFAYWEAKKPQPE